MQSIRVHPPPSATPYSQPNPTSSNQLLIHIKSTTIICSMLTWPDTYHRVYIIPGHDFSGTVASISQASTTTLKPAVFGMTPIDRGSTWSSYVLVSTNEVVLKPTGLGWEEAAELPLCAQTAYEALFVHAGLQLPLLGRSRITSMLGSCESACLVLALRVVVVVVVFFSCNLLRILRCMLLRLVSLLRDWDVLMELGMRRLLSMRSLGDVHQGLFDVVVDLSVNEEGVLISVDSASFGFVEVHKKQLKRYFFILEGSGEVLRARRLEGSCSHLLQPIFAYNYVNGRADARGKVVLIF
ncbi:Polyketide synthase enoylreductase [Penicillium psychrosexuale]|uniref:Polyketide synthase enoylreductase n=1 Tax=Penicillium psychrosexuale TaxID=1002107 RepID=UPI002545547F|nr:Polyketide synthase enoylreductase [Penicillium psychrosexuale]KAJ5795456.1 Polyketide synthase enoylreductase [Penicillium psychrosexuale]